MYWADKIAKEIVDSGSYTPYWVDDMKTPSGFAHVGSLRGPLIHSVIYRALKDAGQKATFTFVFNDLDTCDELPPEFKEALSEHLGKPLKHVPSPDPNFSNLADLLSDDLRKVMESLGVEAEYVSSYEMYKSGKFDEVIRIALDHAEKIQDIYQEVSGSKKKEQGWLPFQVICPTCGKLGTTKVTAWDGKEVTYTCEPNLVKWAKGCGHQGKMSPFGGNGKLPWKVDWPAHWKVMGITVEGAGKDHASAGGSYDIAMALCDEVFHFPKPFKLPYEFFLFGGKKMSSSKGIGLKAHDITKILPPSVARFLFTRTNYKEQAEVHMEGTMAIPDLFDEYDRCWTSYNQNGEESFSRAFELAQIKELPSKNPDLFIPRFRDIANYKQLPNVDLLKKLEEQKGSPLSDIELAIYKERDQFVTIWLGSYAPEDMKLHMSDTIPEAAASLTGEQKEYLSKLIGILESIEDPEKLQFEMFELTKSMGIPPVQAFSAIYISFIGKERGPRAAWFLLQYPKDQVIRRLEEVSK
jgi:lysyl-tRNA synthetase class 1